MKYPTLTRVFSIILAIFGFVMICASIVGFGKNISDFKDNRKQLRVLKDNLSIYEQLSAKLDGKPTYDEQKKIYDDSLDEHQKRKSQQKTDLATHTATLGGILEGKKQLIDASGQLIEAQKQASDAINQIDDGIKVANNTKSQLEVALQFNPAYSVSINQINEQINSLQTTRQSILSGVGQGLDGLLDASYMLNKEQEEQEEEGKRLETEKLELEKEKADLDVTKTELDQLKDDEQKIASSRVKLLKNDKIKTKVEDGNNIIEVASKEIRNKTFTDILSFVFRIVISLCELAAAYFSVISIPIAFENNNDLRKFYISVLAFTILALLVVVVNMCIRQGLSYTALLASIFGIVQSFLVLPRNRVELINIIKNKINIDNIKEGISN